MARIVTYTCDNCGAVKKETNHWFVGSVNGSFDITPWNDTDANSYQGILHLCGDACVLARVQEFLGKVQKGVVA